MKNLEEFCLELKNDILTEIGEDKNWDTADYTMKFYGNSGEGGLTILKKDNQEVRRVRQERFLYFWDAINLLIDRSKVNKGTLTIYPSGEYESEFIWDNQAHLDYLVLDIDTFFSFLYDEVPLYLDRNYHNDTLWDSIEIRISFQEGKIQPLKIVLKTGEITTDYAVLIQNITYDESIYLIKRFEDIYELTNNGELKGVLSPTWNTAIMRYQAIEYFDFKKQVSFEWREENA